MIKYICDRCKKEHEYGVGIEVHITNFTHHSDESFDYCKKCACIVLKFLREKINE